MTLKQEISEDMDYIKRQPTRYAVEATECGVLGLMFVFVMVILL